MPCPLYQAQDYIQVYASLEVYHYGDDILLCVLWSLLFDTHELQNEVAKELLKSGVSMFTCDKL